MSVYVIVVIILFSAWILSNFCKDRAKFFCVCATIVLSCLLGFRDAGSVGIDIVRYARHYEALGSYSILNSFSYSDGSWLYYFLNCLFNKMGVSFQGFVILIAVFQMCVIGHFFWRFSKNPLFSYIIIFGMGSFTFLFSGLRQGIAIAFGLLCFEAIVDKRYGRFALFLALAIGFHTTAIVILLLFVTTRIKFSRLTVGIYVFIFLFCLAFRVQLGNFITLISLDEYIGRYSSVEQIGGTAIFSIIVVILYFIVNYKKIVQKNTLESYLAHGLILLNIIQLCSSYSYMFTRLNLYYMMMIMPIALPLVGDKRSHVHITGRIAKVLEVAFFIVCSSIMFVKFNSAIVGEKLLEYIPFWQA